jgi:hypothetical protein
MWRERVRNLERRNTQWRTCIIARKGNKLQNETQTLFKLKGKKHSKTGKMRNAHCKTWSMARNVKIVKNEKHTL